MKYSIIKSSDIRISKISFGCSNFGGIGSDPKLVGKGDSEAASHEILNLAYNFGINHFDTATTYAAGKSEEILGTWIKKHKIPREKIIISSKVGSKVHSKFSFGKKGLSKKYLNKQVNQSLKRLQIDYLDLFYIHVPDPETPIIETLSTLNNLINEGKIRVIGASNIDLDYLQNSLKISRDNSLAEYKVVQNSYSIINRSDEDSLIPFCKDNNILYVGYGPLAGGLLTGKYKKNTIYPQNSRLQLRSRLYESILTDEVFDKIDLIKKIAKSMGTPLTTLTYSWLYNNKLIDSFLIGSRNASQFESVSQAIDLYFTDDDYDHLCTM
ncbi:MAG: aldo/keto reductase [Desulforhopalus sp.]